MMMWRSAMIVVLACGATRIASATTYYVDSSITDTNVASSAPDCTTYNQATFLCSGGSASAFKTIADLNNLALLPDDQVLFRKSQTWREIYTEPSSGTAGHPILIGVFGTGAAPIINGSLLLTGWTSEVVGGFTAYYKVVTTQPNTVFENNTRYTSVVAKASLTVGTWFWDSGNSRIYIRASGDNAPTNYSSPGIEADQGGNTGVVQAFNKSYVTIQGLNIIKGPYGVWWAGASSTGAVVDTVEAAQNAIDGIVFISALNATAVNCLSHDNLRGGIGFYSSANGGTVSGGSVYNNAPNAGAESPSGSGVTFYQVTNGLVTGVTAYNNTYGIKTFDPTTTTITIRGNTTYSNTTFGIDVDGSGAGIIVERNTVYQNTTHGIAIEFNTPGTIVRYNRVHDDANVSAVAGIELNATINAQVYGNVVYNERNGIALYNSPTGSLVANNLVFNTVDSCLNVSYMNATMAGTAVMDNTMSTCGLRPVALGTYTLSVFTTPAVTAPLWR